MHARVPVLIDGAISVTQRASHAGPLLFRRQENRAAASPAGAVGAGLPGARASRRAIDSGNDPSPGCRVRPAWGRQRLARPLSPGIEKCDSVFACAGPIATLIAKKT
ncbi:hypothetical protein LA76x_2972 [Lysobacter antibioticus]|uniref:Uncharacterized protein n=1 Tax=Lysobacter antibioticus TaxID=84531 RepID=A0A0S2FCD1_LYSAN|nr:hypothetical protein LA76x_2972 [Lysobacter antibioticus]